MYIIMIEFISFIFNPKKKEKKKEKYNINFIVPFAIFKLIVEINEVVGCFLLTRNLFELVHFTICGTVFI